MGKQRFPGDSRLRGLWQSDRRLTFRHYQPPRKLTPARLRKFKSIFGKLKVRWGNGLVTTEYNGFKWKDAFEIIGRDSVSVVIRGYNEILGEDRIQQIFFEPDYYWFWTPWGMREFFRRVK